jgi:ABC-type nitrate/sulfonate/bicarbonate transport system substrate-binding protein
MSGRGVWRRGRALGAVRLASRWAVCAAVVLVLAGCAGPAPAASTQAPAVASQAPASAATQVVVPSAAPASPRPSAAPSLAPVVGATASASGANLTRKAIIAASSDNILPHIAKDKGFFAQHGVDVTVEAIPATTAMAAIQAGEVQFSASAPSAVRAAISGLPLRAVAFFQTEPFNLVTRPDITSVAALRGQQVGGQQPPGDIYDYLVAALKTGGLSIDDVQMLNVGSTQPIAAALSSGQLAGGVSSYPWTQLFEAQGYHVLTGPEIIDMPANGLATSAQLLQNDPQLVRDVLEGLLDGIAWAKSNPDDAVAYFAQTLKLDPSIARGAYEEQMSVLFFEVTPDIEQLVLQRSLPPDYSGAPPAVSDLMDMSMFNELTREKGLR